MVHWVPESVCLYKNSPSYKVSKSRVDGPRSVPVKTSVQKEPLYVPNSLSQDDSIGKEHVVQSRSPSIETDRTGTDGSVRKRSISPGTTSAVSTGKAHGSEEK